MRDILMRRANHLLPLIERAALSSAEIDAIRDALAEDMLLEGLTGDPENACLGAYGSSVDDLIGAVGVP